MGLPNDLTTITVTGTFTTITGAPLSGQVNFSLTTPVEDSTGKVIFNAFTQSAPLNGAGFMSIVLPCTDNADLNPSNFSYLVTEAVPGLGRAYYVQLPHTLGSTVDLSQLAPVATPPAPSVFATGNTWTGPQTFAGNPPVKIPGGAVSGYVLTSDGSGDGTWQAATGGVTSVTAADTSIVITGTASAPVIATGTLDVIAADHPPAGNWSNNAHAITGVSDLAVSGLPGATAASRYVGGTASGAPVSGTFSTGDWVIDQTGKIWVCTTGGTPGTWTQISSAGGTLTQYLAPAVNALTGASTITVNAALGNAFNLTLSSSAWTLGNPSNPVDGQVIRFRLTQGAGGSFLLTFGTAYDFGAGGAPVLSTTAGKVDILSFEYVASISKWCYAGSGLGF